MFSDHTYITAHFLSKEEMYYINGTREFTKSQQRYIRCRDEKLRMPGKQLRPLPLFLLHKAEKPWLRHCEGLQQWFN
jgi:hypothetical protein